jgi:VIT1/CCC1 family predicted Fe2+/Mn2+ transporter
MDEERDDHKPVLDPVERASEAIFGIVMAMSIVGSVSLATAGKQQVREMLLGALGGNLAWGIADGAMYVLGVATDRNRRTQLLRRLRECTDASEAHRMIAEALPSVLAGGASEATLEAIRQRLVRLPLPRSPIAARTIVAGLAVCGVVFLATMPVALPFLVIRDPGIALRASNGLALATLFAYGAVLGRYAGGSAWRYGLSVATLGAVLVGVIMALGG